MLLISASNGFSTGGRELKAELKEATKWNKALLLPSGGTKTLHIVSLWLLTAAVATVELKWLQQQTDFRS